jgi:hypothetical protein
MLNREDWLEIIGYLLIILGILSGVVLFSFKKYDIFYTIIISFLIFGGIFLAIKQISWWAKIIIIIFSSAIYFWILRLEIDPYFNREYSFILIIIIPITIILFYALFKIFQLYWRYLFGIERVDNGKVWRTLLAFILAYICFLGIFCLLYTTIFINNWHNDTLAFHFGRGFENDLESLNYIHFFYFSIVTSATLGYGDISPTSTGAIISTILELLFSIVFIGLFWNAFTSNNHQANQLGNI